MCQLFVEELSSQHTQKVAELEQAMQQKLRERQKVYEEAFNHDMKQFLSTGYLQHRGKSLLLYYKGFSCNIFCRITNHQEKYIFVKAR